MVRVWHFHVVSLEDTREEERCHSLLLVVADCSFNILKGATSRESLVFIVNCSVFVINLHLVEALIAHATSVYDEATLSRSALRLIFLIRALIHARASLTRDWERMGAWGLGQLWCAQLSCVTNHADSPIVEATFPKLPKVN